ncbi:hypothetical protein QBC36DRAFT_354694 [Triangularia setosa]|uniref:RING-type E3 ubiquitin transferase n=1 Tax=Triangularia setosa TaxID=2587417 RepID=A0AAN7A6S4_9PEZI|nr:hypothetical protein QBC36DRAFT_354694 [Podospora setosa]
MALMRSLLSTTVSAQDARISWIENAPGWQEESLMHLLISPPESEILQLTYDVYPLTRAVGLNESTESIALVSCDSNSSTSLVGELITTAKPRAILLYSIKGNCCALQGSYQDFEGTPYESLFTMANQEESIAAMNSTRLAGASAAATITGGINATGPETSAQPHNGNNSAVAMSILYSITGLITLLFLVIIATGAIRAHRYPERYGPRSGYGGRPRQSRAKGLARAVLETLPIVKFGDPAPAKPDPALELESQTSRSSPEPGIGTRLSAIPEEPKTPKTPKTPAKWQSEALGTVMESEDDNEPGVHPARAAATRDTKADETGIKNGKRSSEEHLGCSICTEDFLVGEDVRVLPCDHKFHPPCIDPWLINVSGTCPLCRLDLQPQDERNPEDPHQLAPPLAGEWSDSNNSGQTAQQRRRSLRFLDLHRLRHASVEERIEILRRHRSQQQLRESQPPQLSLSGSTAAAAESDEHHNRRASLADRLRDKFRVPTARQSADDETTPSTAMEAGPPNSAQQ